MCRYRMLRSYGVAIAPEGAHHSAGVGVAGSATHRGRGRCGRQWPTRASQLWRLGRITRRVTVGSACLGDGRSDGATSGGEPTAAALSRADNRADRRWSRRTLLGRGRNRSSCEACGARRTEAAPARASARSCWRFVSERLRSSSSDTGGASVSSGYVGMPSTNTGARRSLVTSSSTSSLSSTSARRRRARRGWGMSANGSSPTKSGSMVTGGVSAHHEPAVNPNFQTVPSDESTLAQATALCPTGRSPCRCPEA